MEGYIQCNLISTFFSACMHIRITMSFGQSDMFPKKFSSAGYEYGVGTLDLLNVH